MANSGRGRDWLRSVMIGAPFIWLGVFFLAPFAIVLKLSFSEARIAKPPYSPTWDTWDGVLQTFTAPNLENYAWVFEDRIYLIAYFNSLSMAATATLFALLIGYPLAYAIARAPIRWRNALILAVIVPFWTSFLIRVYAWIGILKPEGLLSLGLQSVGILGPDETVQIFRTQTSVMIGIVYTYLPFMILPLYANLSKLDGVLLEAAADLGARPFTTFWRVTLPLSLPGIAAGCFLVFIPVVGEFVIPELLGGSDTLMIGQMLWVEFFNNRDWPLASAVAVLLLIVLVIPIVIFQSIAARREAMR